MIDICLVNWQTEYSFDDLQDKFKHTAKYQSGILREIDYPLREPPTGLMILASILENLGYSVDIIDCMILRDPFAFFHEIAPKYRLFGFSCLTNTFPATIKLLKYIHNLNPQAYYIMGGPHVSFTYENELTNFPEIDTIFIGESEQSLPWFVHQALEMPIIDMIYAGNSNSLAKTQNRPEKISKLFTSLLKQNKMPKGLAFRTFTNTTSNNPKVNDTNSIQISSSGFPNAQDLATIPLPARHLINRIYQVADIIVNRGCPNQCSFCSRTRLFPVTRIRPLDDILQELDYILSSGNYRFVNFYDNINVNHKYFNAFLDALIARNMPLPWGAELRADVITQEEAFKLEKANCKLVATGIESSSKEVLKRNFKFQNPEKVAQGIRLIKNAGVAVQAYFIIGLPGDTPERFQATLDFAATLPFEKDVDRLNFFVLTPYPGSDIATFPKKYGVNMLNSSYENYNCHEILVETENLSIDDLKMMMKQAAEFKEQNQLL